MRARGVLATRARLRRRVLVLALAVLAVLVGPSVPSANADGAREGVGRAERHTAVLRASAAAGSVRGDGGLGLAVVHARSVRADNLALASAACDGCSATAISVQVVLADRAPTTVTVGNTALASTQGCTDCQATAIAYQFVVVVDGSLSLSAQGRAELRAIDREAEALARSGRPGPEVAAQAQALAGRVIDVLVGQLSVRPLVRVTRDHREHGGPGRDG